MGISKRRPQSVIGITAAIGTIYGVRVLDMLRALGVETHLVVSCPGKMTRTYETALSNINKL